SRNCSKQPGYRLIETPMNPGIEMARAFSALASPVRLPSPLGWAGMRGAFGALRFADESAVQTVVARASRPCESCSQHTGETPVPLRWKRHGRLSQLSTLNFQLSTS